MNTLQEIIDWFHSKKMLKSWVKVFGAALLAAFLADTADVFSVDFTDLRTYVASGIAAVGPLILTALDPNDDRAGVNRYVEDEE